jgi:hypothetical protein
VQQLAQPPHDRSWEQLRESRSAAPQNIGYVDSFHKHFTNLIIVPRRAGLSSAARTFGATPAAAEDRAKNITREISNISAKSSTFMPKYAFEIQKCLSTL